VQFLAGFSCTEADLWEASPFRLLDPFESDAVSLLSALYRPEERINIVSEFETIGGNGQPTGCGETLNRDEWLERIRHNGPPISDAGTWIRPNPTDGNGISDANIAAFRFAVLESDSIPLSLQLPFFARLPLPIAAIITSGGKSLHAWVQIDAQDAGHYRELVSTLFRILRPFGIDSASQSPARLSRLPGVCRRMGAAGDNRQRLLYLNPAADYSRILG
jgi:regulatory protein RepA